MFAVARAVESEHHREGLPDCHPLTGSNGGSCDVIACACYGLHAGV